MPYFRQKACISLFEIHTDSPGSAKGMAEPGVGLQPNVACKFKRAGFLEWRCEGNAAFANSKCSACDLRLARTATCNRW